ncbi:cytochrome P450 87A3-like [Chenopodium quinoa]|uniref:cytochrome P450 87A3-like n=1 Tax=Chenopodium quinoa TaxID=63459 RepID=UPI000B76C774|nr:cytochrome P450 87A3-like [Chenopodium quinoa]
MRMKMSIEFVAKQLFGYVSDKSKEKIGEKFGNISQGLFSLPLNIPGTTYHSCLKSQREVMDMMRTALKERLAAPESYRGDFLDHALKDLSTEKFLSEEFILQIMFGLLFASSESTSMTLTLVLKFLSENPHVLKEIEAEHEKIIMNRESPDSPLTWAEVKSMTFTLQVINESLRLGNVSLGVLRRTLKDIEINGYTIPAGWTVMLVTSACQYNSDIYKDPLTFNPWRWKEMQPDVIAKNFMPFGGGTRQCAGAEFAKVLMTIFLHNLVTNYRWERIKGGEIVRTPILGFQNSLHVKLTKKN